MGRSGNPAKRAQQAAAAITAMADNELRLVDAQRLADDAAAATEGALFVVTSADGDAGWSVKGSEVGQVAVSGEWRTTNGNTNGTAQGVVLLNVTEEAAARIAAATVHAVREVALGGRDPEDVPDGEALMGVAEARFRARVDALVAGGREALADMPELKL